MEMADMGDSKSLGEIYAGSSPVFPTRTKKFLSLPIRQAERPRILIPVCTGSNPVWAVRYATRSNLICVRKSKKVYPYCGLGATLSLSRDYILR